MSEVEQQKKLKAKKDEIILKRTRDGTHASLVQQQLGIGEGGGAYAIWDDGNKAWETENEDNDMAQEAMWRGRDFAFGQDVPRK
ncbi:hypothetical protein VE03_10185 [Pseudogymnoascus sp. 23342-1-I1]|nr:hypothetical protein VE03_10185 [Pseudogymnoascus sp. 23342-1-I1]